MEYIPDTEKPRTHSPARFKTIMEEEATSMLGLDVFPYQAKLSFVPLINFWKKQINNQDKGTATLARLITKELDNALELQAPINDKNLLEEKKDFIELLMAGLFPPSTRNVQMARASRPFSMKSFYNTPPLQKLVESGKFRVCVDQDPSFLRAGNIIQAASLILNQFYGQSIDIEAPSLFTVASEDGGTQRHLKSDVNPEFVEIKKLKPLKALSQKQINELLTNIYDLDLWLELVPPENFEFQGFVIISLHDITEEETLSRLKHALLEKDAVIARGNIVRLESYLRNYFKLPELRIGITALDYPRETAVFHEYKIRHDFLAKKHDDLLNPAYAGSFYEKACQYGEPLIIEDIKGLPERTPLEDTLLEEGFRSIIIAPLKDKEKNIIGLLELGAPQPYQLNSFMVMKMQEIVPLFRTAIQRSREEIDNLIEVIIREQYTALHPSVDWRFIQAAYNLMEKREREGDQAKVEQIVFKDVYPLYGQADIVGSSQIRNESIQVDLLANLEAAREVLLTAGEQQQSPMIDQYLYKVEKELRVLKQEFITNDEYRLVDFITNELHHLFELLRGKNKHMDEAIRSYRNQIDPQLNIVYNRRKKYEDSVTYINDALASYLEQEQRKVQKMLPHYFEKYKTDGVEYDIYVGQSLLRNEQFSEMHLRNLRLWQLITMCEITRKVEALQQELPVPLTTAQLILVHSSSLSIRFRMDEKQFDVDGAYNVRYEIVKKRVDKALIKETGERLTVSGKIAIVYSDNRDRSEYLDYIDYLIAQDYITDEVEDLDIGELQAVQGLRALRIKVKNLQ